MTDRSKLYIAGDGGKKKDAEDIDELKKEIVMVTLLIVYILFLSQCYIIHYQDEHKIPLEELCERLKTSITEVSVFKFQC